MAITDVDLGDLLETTLNDLYGIQVRRVETGVFHISAGGKEAVVTSEEVELRWSAAGFVAFLKKKLGL